MKKQFYIYVIPCIISPLIGIIALDTLGGGILNGMWGRYDTPIVEPNALIAMTGLFSLLTFGLCAYSLVQIYKKSKKKTTKVVSTIFWMLAVCSTGLVVWVRSWAR